MFGLELDFEPFELRDVIVRSKCNRDLLVPLNVCPIMTIQILLNVNQEEHDSIHQLVVLV